MLLQANGELNEDYTNSLAESVSSFDEPVAVLHELAKFIQSVLGEGQNALSEVPEHIRKKDGNLYLALSTKQGTDTQTNLNLPLWKDHLSLRYTLHRMSFRPEDEGAFKEALRLTEIALFRAEKCVNSALELSLLAEEISRPYKAWMEKVDGTERSIGEKTAKLA